MGRPKKITSTENLKPEDIIEVESVTEVKPRLIELLSVDFPSEGLNNMAKKINEIAEWINKQ